MYHYDMDKYSSNINIYDISLYHISYYVGGISYTLYIFDTVKYFTNAIVTFSQERKRREKRGELVNKSV